MKISRLKVAVVHDWYCTYAGSERVVEQILKVLPQADLFAVVDFLPADQRGFIQHKQVTTTFIQKLPFAKRSFRQYLVLMPLAIEQLDLSAYDLVISSSHAVAKGVLTAPHQLHISYIHSPMRYAWDLQHQYLQEANLTKGIKSWLVRWMLHQLRLWDRQSASGVDVFVANSRFIARRIEKVYRRSAQVIYPPVSWPMEQDVTPREDFYLTASRLVPYKRVDLIVEAFTKMPDHQLVVIGEGEQMPRLRAIAGGNVQFLGYQSTAQLFSYMQRARAFVFAAEEDFGITPVEAQGCGTPVIAYGRGGICESVVGLERDCPTGVFFLEQTPESLMEAIHRFEAEGDRITPQSCRDNAFRFADVQFRKEFAAFVETAWDDFVSKTW